MYTSIVVPLDGSAFGERALPVTLALARRSDAAVHLVHVSEPIVIPRGGPMYDTRLHNEQRNEVRSKLISLAAQLSEAESLRVTVEVLDGPVVPTLQHYLAKRRHDLVVMMTHGRGGLSRVWLGSVADGLVRQATVPLLLVRPGAEWPSDLMEPLFCRVLVPLDGSAMADEALDHAVSLATPNVTVYTLLTVVVPLPQLADGLAGGDARTGWPDVDEQHQSAQAHLTSMAAELRESGALVETRVVEHQHPAQAILGAADDEHSDAIALSTHGRGAVSRLLLGSVADKVVRGATVPVLLFRPALPTDESADRAIAPAAMIGSTELMSRAVAGGTHRP